MSGSVGRLNAPRKRLALRVLDAVERAGNRLPAPLTLFAIFCVLVAAVSFVASKAGVSVVHPGTGQRVGVVNLLNAAGLRRMLVEAVSNFAAFPPLGTVLAVTLGIGVAERSGLISAALRGLVAAVPRPLLPAAIVFAGVNASLAADAGFVVLLPVGAMIFAGAGRHPLAGLAAAFAGTAGGFSANLLVTSLDPLLGGLTQAAARLVDPDYVVEATANWWFMIASTFLLTILGTWVTTRVVEPRLGPWQGEAAAQPSMSLEPHERRGLRAAAVAALAGTLLGALLVVPDGAPLRGEGGSLEPFYRSIVALLTFGFLGVGLAYGIAARTIRSDHDVEKMTGDTLGTMGTYIALAFVAAQFVAWFGWSNLGIVLAVKGAGGLRAAGLTGVPLVVGFVIVSASINLLIASASAKWAVLASVFVPMLMLVGWSPETAQAIYRVGDSITNPVTPLMPYYPLVLTVAHRYDRKAGVGTMLSLLLPYSAAFFVGWTALLVVWLLLGIPLGPGAPLHWAP